MKDELVRFGVAMEQSLLEELDALVEARGVTRSRRCCATSSGPRVMRSQISRGVPAVATLTLVYDHHVRELTEKLTEFQHRLGEKVRSTLHVHLDHDRCLEVVILRGRSDELQRLSERLLATRGVTHRRPRNRARRAPRARPPPPAPTSGTRATPPPSHHLANPVAVAVASSVTPRPISLLQVVGKGSRLAPLGLDRSVP